MGGDQPFEQGGCLTEGRCRSPVGSPLRAMDPCTGDHGENAETDDPDDTLTAVQSPDPLHDVSFPRLVRPWSEVEDQTPTGAGAGSQRARPTGLAAAERA
jgi:hypothetical protein